MFGMNVELMILIMMGMMGMIAVLAFGLAAAYSEIEKLKGRLGFLQCDILDNQAEILEKVRCVLK